MDSGFMKEVQARSSDFFRQELFACNPFPPKKGVGDDTFKFLLMNRQGKPRYFAACSTPTNPHLIQRGARRAASVHRRLPSRLGRHVLKAELVDRWNDLSFAVYPYCHPLPQSRLRRVLTRFWLRRPLLNWLLDSSRETMEAVQGEERDRLSDYLTHAQCDGVSPVLRRYSQETQEKLNAQAFQAYHTISHNDLWAGNILLATGNYLEADFKLIDWAGGQQKGFPIYDLLRVDNYLRLSEARLKQELLKHSQQLHCEPADLKLHLSLALAHIYTHLEHFPLDRFNQVSEYLFALLQRALGEDFDTT